MMGRVTRRKRRRIWINQFSDIRLVSMCDAIECINVIAYIAAKASRTLQYHACRGSPKLINLVAINFPKLIAKAGCKGSNGKNG